MNEELPSSQIKNILRGLSGTSVAEILKEMDRSYQRIADEQSVWYKKSGFTCPEACGECCRNFEPDLLECEACYMAAWLLENQPEVAAKVADGTFPYPREGGCQFWKEDDPYHCSIYGGRSFICRLFGACANHDKCGRVVFKPCKFYPAEKLSLYKVPLAHKQYSQEEIEKIFGTIPPTMESLMEEALSFNPDNHNTYLIREILPQTIRRIQWLLMINNGNDDDTPEPLAC